MGYMNNREVSSLSEIIETNREFGVHAPLWWRGQARAAPDWALRPRVFRNSHSHDYERNLVGIFKANAPAVYPNCPTEDAEWLFLMQHHGLPTRLLDWSDSILVAAFFAVENESEDEVEDAVIWGIEPEILNRLQMRSTFDTNWTPGLVAHDHPIAKRLISNAFADNPAGDMGAFAILDVSVTLRSLVQLSVFTLHGDSMDLRETLEKNLIQLAIPKARKKELREELVSVGFSRFSLFPDLDNLSTVVTENAHHMDH